MPTNREIQTFLYQLRLALEENRLRFTEKAEDEFGTCQGKRPRSLSVNVSEKHVLYGQYTSTFKPLRWGEPCQ